MLSRRRMTTLAVLALLTTLSAACSPEDIASAAAKNCCDPKFRDVAVVPRVSGSGVSGRVIIQYGFETLLSASISFAGVERNSVGARYAVHVHPGQACGGVNVPITYDLGAPGSSIRLGDQNIPSVAIERAPVLLQHVSSGYYLDVHAPNDATGLPLACAVFPW